MEEGVIYPLSDSPTLKMSQSSPADEGPTFEHLWSTLEPDSTYFDLPPANPSGSSEVSNRTEVTMDVFQMRGMTDSVMVSVLRQQGWGPEPATRLISLQGWAGGSGGATEVFAGS
ncbi:hypothetical protein DV515_00012964 [Chloebia gouldiae]|uniref:Uncharacterized protein n=1 Tax=Chloebia gouldiae TaxID=44316 RepID=A0A3L8S3H1_CHLGU|nr:hypothetical protein DV515_00012964 [Chloebia gouldiae]